MLTPNVDTFQIGHPDSWVKWKVNWNDAMSRGLVGAFIFTNDGGPRFLNLVDGVQGSLNGTFSAGWCQYNQQGFALEGPGAYINTGIPVERVFPTGSFFLFGTPSSTGAGIIGKSNGGEIDFSFRLGAATQIIVGIDGAWSYHSGFSGLGDGSDQAYFASWDDTNNVYTVGADDVVDEAGTGVVAPTGANLTIATPNYRFDGTPTATVKVVYFWSRRISVSEYRTLRREPYRLITSNLSRFVPYTTPAAGADFMWRRHWNN